MDAKPVEPTTESTSVSRCKYLSAYKYCTPLRVRDGTRAAE